MMTFEQGVVLTQILGTLAGVLNPDQCREAAGRLRALPAADEITRRAYHHTVGVLERYAADEERVREAELAGRS